MNAKELVKANWPLMIGLGALALIRPVLKITGAIEYIGQPFGSILMTILISLAWLTIVLVRKVPNPIPILIGAGLSYALFAILLSGILSPILDGKLEGPLTNPLALVSVFATNAIWGLLIGGMANAIRRNK
ncbi:hypothetical protein [Cohnella thailandensis]|uniref:Uncharacterized protein n=1 Tax=Cohnella thailandensis TaxID=557557 RepID=A0A841SVW7_9BACL|nr:hypothetical protein [Cohnella thailandensis]MBB6634235.1 hypothetical protein [Cohnella thailandensis]MBP1972267.1 hypothetical protein [Cohnella thailandensis]